MHNLGLGSLYGPKGLFSFRCGLYEVVLTVHRKYIFVTRSGSGAESVKYQSPESSYL